MDVQTENTDSPPGESQPSGKIRKGFKLFGKRKPGNIFSIRSKSEGNNKSPLNRSKTLDGGGPEAAESEQDAEKEKLQGDGEQQTVEDEPMGEYGVLAAAPARTSISSASSAKSLGFLSILRGGRRGVGDRRVHTVSQPVSRQRRGIKGLFGKFHSKDKDEKEESQDVPPSPLLMSSRSNSVEIIKEDLTLTPKSPRALDSPGTESSEPSKSLTALDSSTATSPSKTVTPGDESKTNQPLPTTQAAMVPGETSLSSLLADISSLLTFDSISGGGDIMADVEAEWGKASSAISDTISDTSPLYVKPIVPSPLTTASITTTTKLSTTFTLTTTQPSSPMKPSSIITTLTKSSTLTTQTVKSTGLSLDSSTSVTTQPLKPVTNISAPIMSSLPITTMKSPLTATISAPPNMTTATTKAPSDSPSITATFNKLASEKRTETPKTTESKPSPVAAPSPQALTKTSTPVSHTSPASLTQSSTTKLDLTSSLQVNKAPVIVSVTSTITEQPSPPAPLISSKMATTEVTSAPVSVSSVSISKPAPTTDLNKTTPSIVSEPLNSTILSKPQQSSISVPFSASITEVLPITPATPPVSMNGMPPPAKISPAIMSLQSQPLSNTIQVSPTPMAPSLLKEAPLSAFQPKVTLAPVDTVPCQPKVSIAPAEIAPPLFKTPVPATKTIPITSPQIVPASPQPAFSTPTCYASSLSRDGSDKKRESQQSSVDGHLTSPKSPEAWDILQQDSTQIKEDKKRASQGHHTTGLSKIPVVGGGKAKIPVRVSQHTEEETNKNVSMSLPEEASSHFNSHDTESKDKIANSEVDSAVSTSKNSQEESQQQPKASTCLPRDSKIPVKHGSQIPQAKDPARTKIPVSKVPVRRAGGKPAAPSSSSSTQIRK